MPTSGHTAGDCTLSNLMKPRNLGVILNSYFSQKLSMCYHQKQLYPLNASQIWPFLSLSGVNVFSSSALDSACSSNFATVLISTFHPAARALLQKCQPGHNRWSQGLRPAFPQSSSPSAQVHAHSWERPSPRKGETELWWHGNPLTSPRASTPITSEDRQAFVASLLSDIYSLSTYVCLNPLDPILLCFLSLFMSITPKEVQHIPSLCPSPTVTQLLKPFCHALWNSWPVTSKIP